MKKIGITSYWCSSSNYGQILQGVALQSVLRKLGYCPCTIAYDMDAPEQSDHSKIDKFRLLLLGEVSIARRIIRKIKYLLSSNKINKRREKCDFSKRGFDEFKNKYLKMSIGQYKTCQEVADSHEFEDYYAFITGSDQVWHEASGPKRRKYLLLEFAKENQKRISYAASFGRNKIIPIGERNEYKRGLKRFSSVSVRELSGVKICKSLGVKASCELDPTLLLSKDEWFSHCNMEIPARNAKTAFFYTLSANNEIVVRIKELLQSLGYKCIYVCSDEFHEDANANCEATIEKWLQYIALSSIVVTTSYHGTIFSINFNTPVLSIAKNGDIHNGSNQRMFSVMSKLGILDSLIAKYDENAIKKVINQKIDWDSVNNVIAQEREKSTFYLQNALK